MQKTKGWNKIDNEMEGKTPIYLDIYGSEGYENALILYPPASDELHRAKCLFLKINW